MTPPFCKCDENIEMRYSKGLGIINSVMSILKEISFGIYYYEVALLLRNSLFINGILFNVEALVNLKPKHIKSLESCDFKLMQSLFLSPVSTPHEAYFIETSTIPIKFVLVGKRLMYLWNLLQKSERGLAKQVLLAQIEFPSTGDWVSQVREDLISCEIHLSFQEIKQMKRGYFKQLVDKRIKYITKCYLTKVQSEHSKTSNLIYSDKPQPYLLSDRLTLLEKQTLFKLRCKVNICKESFKSSHLNDMKWVICDKPNTYDSVQHYIHCEVLIGSADLQPDIKHIRYEDLFSNLESQVRFIKVWMKIEEKRSKMTNSVL